jgi:hypothetical protein
VLARHSLRCLRCSSQCHELHEHTPAAAALKPRHSLHCSPPYPAPPPPRPHHYTENGHVRLGGLGISRRFEVVQRQLATLPNGLREMQQVRRSCRTALLLVRRRYAVHGQRQQFCVSLCMKPADSSPMPPSVQCGAVVKADFPFMQTSPNCLLPDLFSLLPRALPTTCLPRL